MNNDFDIKRLDELPKSAGVYLWKDADGEIIYIGKAKNLKNRMNQYFKGAINSYKTHKLVSEIADFEIKLTNNENEALILEKRLVDEHSPKYNILLQDFKKYPYLYIKLAKGSIVIKKTTKTAEIQDKFALVYGPFPFGKNLHKLVKFVEREVLYEKGIPLENQNYKQLQEKYQQVRQILDFKDKKYLKNLADEELQFAYNGQYEVAKDLKEIREYLTDLYGSQNVDLITEKDFHVFQTKVLNNYLIITGLFYQSGILFDTQNFNLDITNNINDEFAFFEFLDNFYQYYKIPDKIILTSQFANNIAEFKLIKNIVSFPKKGKFYELLKLAANNLENYMEITFKKVLEKNQQKLQSLKDLKKLLNYPKEINDIIMIDNSHMKNENVVSVIVNYYKGLKQPQNYRNFKIELNNNKSDLEYMKQGFLKALKFEFVRNADLIIADGGKLQVDVIKKILAKNKLNIPVIGLVKNSKHKTDHLINLEGLEIDIKPLSLKNFLAEIQEEVDRHAKFRYKNKYINNSLEGTLVKIKGLDKNDENLLLEYFGSYSKIYNASLKELKQALKNEKLAQKVYDHYRKEQDY
ncbi:GIY-YIG nuclease family protein [Candidatus Mycoplasma pogonae]